MEALRVADVNLTVYIHPSNAKKWRQAIRRQLSSLLFTYSEVFDGVILAFEEHIWSRSSKLLPGLVPHFGVELKANLLLFSPTPDMLLEGKVMKMGKESINVIVLGFSSASILSEDIRADLTYNNEDGVFSSISHKRHVIKVGSMIRFLVKSFDDETLHINGSLVPPHSGSVSWLSKHCVGDGLYSDSKLKRNREEKDSILCSMGDFSVDHGHLQKSRKRDVVEQK